MKAILALALAGAITLIAVSASALPISPAARAASGVEPVQFVCGPFRCFRRPFWRYGRGVGFQPYRRFGPAPFRRFGYRPFGFGRPGGLRRF